MKCRTLISFTHRPLSKSVRDRLSFAVGSRTVVAMRGLRRWGKWGYGLGRSGRPARTCARPGLAQDQRQKDRDSDSVEKGREGRLVMCDFALAAAARSHQPRCE